MEHIIKWWKRAKKMEKNNCAHGNKKFINRNFLIHCASGYYSGSYVVDLSVDKVNLEKKYLYVNCNFNADHVQLVVHPWKSKIIMREMASIKCRNILLNHLNMKYQMKIINNIN